MYANVIFLVHYSVRDRRWTISFPFMSLPLLTSRMEVQSSPLPLYWVRLRWCCPAAKCEREAGISQDSRGRSRAAIMKPLQPLVKQADAARAWRRPPSPAEVRHCASVWTGHKLARESIQSSSSKCEWVGVSPLCGPVVPVHWVDVYFLFPSSEPALMLGGLFTRAP